MTSSVTSGRCHSEPLQQPLEILELDLRPGWVAGAAAEFVEDTAGALQFAFRRDLDRAVVVCETLIVAVAVQRVGTVLAIALTLSIGVGRGSTIGLLALTHFFANGLSPLLQGLQRVALGADRVARLLLAQSLARILHRALRLSKRLRDVAETVAKLAHELAQLLAQLTLHAGQLFGGHGLAVLTLTLLSLALLTALALLSLLAETLLAVLLLKLTPKALGQ